MGEPKPLTWAKPRYQTSQLLSWLQLAGKTKVCELDVHVIIQEDVLRLQIPMHNVEFVQIADYLQQGSHDLPGMGQAHVTLTSYSAGSGNKRGDQSPYTHQTASVGGQAGTI